MAADRTGPAADSPWITVVGMGADGFSGLGDTTRELIRRAPLVLAGHRLQTMLPDIPGQDRRRWPTPLLSSVDELLAQYQGKEVLLLDAGDPLLYGIGSVLVERLGAASVRIVPTVSSVALAGARMGWSAESVDVVPVDGRGAQAVLARLIPGRRLVILSADQHTPSAVATVLIGAGYGRTAMTVLGELGGSRESAQLLAPAQWIGRVAPRLNVICLEVQPGPSVPLVPAVPGLPDEASQRRSPSVDTGSSISGQPTVGGAG